MSGEHPSIRAWTTGQYRDPTTPGLGIEVGPKGKTKYVATLKRVVNAIRHAKTLSKKKVAYRRADGIMREITRHTTGSIPTERRRSESKQTRAARDAQRDFAEDDDE